MPIYWECDRCTACCRWPGQVRLTGVEIGRMAAFLGMTEDEFIQRHTRLDRARTGLALSDRADGSCTFLEGKDCQINAVKPEQCRGFPNLWNFPGFKEMCQARPHEVSPEEWRRRVGLGTGDQSPVISGPVISVPCSPAADL